MSETSGAVSSSLHGNEPLLLSSPADRNDRRHAEFPLKISAFLVINVQLDALAREVCQP